MKHKVNQYINQIDRGLQLPYKIRKKIKMELTSEIHLRMEAGEGLDDILSSIGSPKEVIAELESNYEHEYFSFRKTRNFALAVWSVVTVLMGGFLFYSLVTLIGSKGTFSKIIGNGNMAVYIAYKYSLKEIVFGLCAEVVLFLFPLLQVMKQMKFLKCHKDME